MGNAVIAVLDVVHERVGLRPLLADSRYVSKDYSMEVLWGMGTLLLTAFVILLVTHRSTGRVMAFLAASFLPLVASLALAMHCFNVMSEHLGPEGMADSEGEGRFWGLWRMALMVRLGSGITAVSLLATVILGLMGKRERSTAPVEGRE